MHSEKKVKVAQSCSTLCDPTDYTGHWILQAKILEWVALPFSRGSSHPRDQIQVCHIAGGFFTRWAQGSPRILEWVAYHLSNKSSWPRIRTRVSWIFTNWAMWEANAPWSLYFSSHPAPPKVNKCSPECVFVIHLNFDRCLLSMFVNSI